MCSMRQPLIWIFAVGFVAIAPAVMAQANLHDAPKVYEGLLGLVSDKANMWADHLRGYATTLFWSLTTISLVWTFGLLAMRQAEFGEIVGELVRFILVTGFFYALLLYSVELASAIVDSFRQAGAAAAGVEKALRPGDMFGLGVKLAKALTFPTVNPALALHSAFAGIIVLLCFAFIAALMGITLIESYVVINASVLLMRFGGSQWTREYAISMLRGALAIGVKLFVLTLIVGLIMSMAREWQMLYTRDDESTFTILGMALVCAVMCKTVPDYMSTLISGVSPGGGGVIGGMAAAGMAGAAAGMAVLQSSGLLGGSGNAMQSISDLLKGSGSGTPPSVSGSGVGGGSGGGSGSSSFMNSMNSGSSGGGARTPPPNVNMPRTGGGGSSYRPPSSSAPSGSSPSGATPSSSSFSAPSSSGSSAPKSSGINAGTAAHMATDGLVRAAGIATSIAVPGAEGASSVSVGPPPAPRDPGSLSDSISDTPENVIRPAQNASAPDMPGTDAPAPTPSSKPDLGTMAGLREAMNLGKEL